MQFSPLPFFFIVFLTQVYIYRLITFYGKAISYVTAELIINYMVINY